MAAPKEPRTEASITPLPDTAINTALKVTSRIDGFRRCGTRWSVQPMIVSMDRFTDAEIERLKADPMLIVEEVAISG